MKKVLVFGTFDSLHKGHIYFLKKSKEKGDHLYVIVARDRNVLYFKGRKAVQNENTRLENVKKLGFVHNAILGESDHKYMKTIKEIQPDIICLGYDQKSIGLEKNLRENNMQIPIERIDSYRADEFKSSIINGK